MLGIFIAHSTLVEIAWVSDLQSRQLGTHKYFNVFSHEASNGYFHILLASVKAATVGYLGYLVTLLLYYKSNIYLFHLEFRLMQSLFIQFIKTHVVVSCEAKKR